MQEQLQLLLQGFNSNNTILRFLTLRRSVNHDVKALYRICHRFQRKFVFSLFLLQLPQVCI